MSFRFAFLADCQLGAYATFSGMTQEDVARYAARDMRAEVVPRVEGFEWDADRYAAAIEEVNYLRPDFAIMGGDMVDDPADPDQLEELLRITAKLDEDIPMRWVPGNHDIAADTVVPTEHSIDKYREIFGADYYAFDHGDARFVVLDTVVIDHPENVSGELNEQMAFLEFELRAATDRRVILIGHHPLFTGHPDEPDTYWNLPLERRGPILELIHKHGVRIGFAGHWHRNSLAYDGQFEMVTSGSVGYPLGSDPSGYRIVDVTAAGVTHEYRPLDLEG